MKHANERDGSVISDLSSITDKLRFLPLPYDTKSTADGALAAYDTLKSPRGTELLWTSSAELAQNQARIWIPSLERARYSKAAAGEGVDAIEEDALCPFLRCSSKSVGLLLNRIRRDVNAGMVCFCRPSEDYAGRDVSQVAGNLYRLSSSD